MIKNITSTLIVLVLASFLCNVGLAQNDMKKGDTIKIQTEQKKTRVDSLVTKTTEQSDNTWIWVAIIAVIVLVLILGYFMGRPTPGGTSSGSTTTETTVKKTDSP